MNEKYFKQEVEKMLKNTEKYRTTDNNSLEHISNIIPAVFKLQIDQEKKQA